MSDSKALVEHLGRERDALRRVLSLRWFHCLTLALSLLATVGLWTATDGFATAREATRFEHEAGMVLRLLERRLRRWQDGSASNADAAEAAADPSSPGPRPERAEAARAALADALSGVLDRRERLVGLRVARAGVTLLDERDGHVPLHVSETALSLEGGWRVRVWSTPELERRMKRYLPLAVLGTTLVIDALLLALFIVQSRAARRTLALSARLEVLSAELARSNADLESFARIASHDLKTPLRGIAMLLGFAREDLDASDASGIEDLRHHLARIEEQRARMDRLIDGVLDYSLVGRKVAGSSRVDPRELVGSIGRALGVDDRRLRVLGDPRPFDTDATRLGRVLSNLVGNAFKHHDDPERAVVSVSVERRDGRLRFEVADDGPGIAAEHHERVFETFRRLPSHAAQAGHGLGLAIVKRSVETMGGTVSLRSSPGDGTRFLFDWPETGQTEQTGQTDRADRAEVRPRAA